MSTIAAIDEVSTKDFNCGPAESAELRIDKLPFTAGCMKSSTALSEKSIGEAVCIIACTPGKRIVRVSRPNYGRTDDFFYGRPTLDGLVEGSHCCNIRDHLMFIASLESIECSFQEISFGGSRAGSATYCVPFAQ